MAAGGPAAAQDVRGLENCSAEKQIDRRTSCLQANVDYLQQALQKTIRETRQKMNAAQAEIAALRAEAASLTRAIGELRRTLDELDTKKPAAEPKK